MRGYTLDQLAAFARAHGMLAAQRQRDELVVARAAQATQDGFRKVMAALDEAAAGRA
ncbi:hypothetical protein [Thauera sp.]|uniref:hypothetical protein n=1 Tax=Thauera sp. TaxID=1905334 RepID=UPI0039E4859B